jgi:hypothetical protein
MTALNCANCGANLNYKEESPVAICKYCDSINVLENNQMHFHDQKNSEFSSVNHKELKPRIMLPEDKFVVSYCEEDGNIQGGNLLVSNTEVFFRPHIFNLGDLDDKFFKLSNIEKIEKVNKNLGLRREIHFIDKNGNIMKLISWNRDGIISAIESRKKNLI